MFSDTCLGVGGAIVLWHIFFPPFDSAHHFLTGDECSADSKLHLINFEKQMEIRQTELGIII